MKRTVRVLLTVMLLILCLTGCGQGRVPVNDQAFGEGIPRKKIVIGFSQVGAESDWRNANTESMRNTFSAANGYELLIEDGQQKQSNQITAIRKFIQQEVDYIVLAPVTEKGWDTVLTEARDAGIPVIIVDRMVDVGDESLFSAWVGSDFELEADKLTTWLHDYVNAIGMKDSDVRVVDLQGTIGASAQIGRTTGLENAARRYGWTLLNETVADFNQAKGREAMEHLLERYTGINVVYCENDNSALGAIEALEAAGLKPGSDILNGEVMVLSFDGVREGIMDYVRSDVISAIAECNPHHGPRVKVLIDALELRYETDKYSYVTEQVFANSTLVDKVYVDGIPYDISVMGEETGSVSEPPLQE